MVVFVIVIVIVIVIVVVVVVVVVVCYCCSSHCYCCGQVRCHVTIYRNFIPVASDCFFPIW